MKLIKSLQLIACVVCLLFSSQVVAQNPGWETCGATAGTLSGTTSSLYATDTTPAPVLTVTPSPVGTIPTTEYLMILNDSLALDSLGNSIIASNLNGRFIPADYGLMAGDSFSVVVFSYDIQQIKLAVQGILHNGGIPFVGSCCNALDLAAPVPGICDSLNAAGINDSSDVNNINDLLTFLGAFSGGGSTSLRGLNAVLVGINDQIGTLNNLGCTNGVGEICYATDSLASGQDHYAVSTMTSTYQVEGNEALKIAVSPNPFYDQISTGILSQKGGEHMIRVFDATGRTLHQEVRELSEGEQTVWINLNDLPAGLYYLQVSDKENVATQKIVKR